MHAEACQKKYPTNDQMAFLGRVKTLLYPAEAMRIKMKSRKNLSWNSCIPVNICYEHWEEIMDHTHGWLVISSVKQYLSSCWNRYLIIKHMPAPWVYGGVLEECSVTSVPAWPGSQNTSLFWGINTFPWKIFSICLTHTYSLAHTSFPNICKRKNNKGRKLLNFYLH